MNQKIKELKGKQTMEENIIYVICSWPLNEEDFKPQVKEIKMEKNSSMDHLTVLNALKKKKNKFRGGGNPWEKRSATNRQIIVTEQSLQNEVFQESHR